MIDTFFIYCFVYIHYLANLFYSASFAVFSRPNILIIESSEHEDGSADIKAGTTPQPSLTELTASALNNQKIGILYGVWPRHFWIVYFKSIHGLLFSTTVRHQ